jgi:hypothetical protein
MKISIVLDLANDYSVNSGVFCDSGNYVKEYANLCSATALYLLALQSEELSEIQRQEMVKKCESFIKLQEEIEETRFSIETLSFSPTKRKRKKNSKYDNEAFTSYNPPESIVENQTIDVKEVILAAQQAEQTYYSVTGSDDCVNTLDPKSSPQKKSALTKKKKSALPKKQKPKVEVDYELQVQSSTSTCDNSTLIVPYSENCSEQIQIVSPANLSQVQEVKLEAVQEVVVPVIVQAPDYTGYASAAPPDVSQQPEVGYYNFSLELLKSFSERFQGRVSIDGLLMSPLKKFPGFIFLQFIFKFINK